MAQHPNRGAVWKDDAIGPLLLLKSTSTEGVPGSRTFVAIAPKHFRCLPQPSTGSNFIDYRLPFLRSDDEAAGLIVCDDIV